ncbi:transcriptional regulator [Allokutzneria multivorans]|uniref:Transcriptional regulator n=1 Tax=Allokutzneria multivorans TaxID=1142134 RepID=A0ABP7SI53_9PSEU
MAYVPAKLDQVLLDPTRLSIVALLAASEWCEFAFVRDSVELSDSALSKQISTLRTAELIEVRKGYAGNRPKTWVRATAEGCARLDGHVRALQDIATRAAERAGESG